MIARRGVLRAASAWPLLPMAGLGGCTREPGGPRWSARWLGASAERGHRLRDAAALPAPDRVRRTDVLVIGGGIAGLAALRALDRAGIAEAHLLELEDDAGGNSRATSIGGIACPLGAHYLPLPGPHAHEVSAWLEELGVARHQHGRWRYDERMLCHSPQERLFIDGAWQEGLLPAADPAAPAAAQYRAFAAEVAAAQRDLGFAMPTLRAPWRPGHAALDAQTFAAWLDARGLADPHLRWYLDYCCRDDYGAGPEVVSAWAGLHYFASRHGFEPEHAGPDAIDADAQEAVLTWPEGNAWLARRLAAPLAARVQTGQVALRVEEGRHGVEVDAWDAARGRHERWQARALILALPLFVAARLIRSPSPALADALRGTLAHDRHAPWLVANLHVTEPLLQRHGAPPAWDNVIYRSAGLGYVDAMHQSMRPYAGPTVLTAYWALPGAERRWLLASDAHPAADALLAQLVPTHPDLPAKLAEVALMRHGHAMSIPVPGARGSVARAALAAWPGRLSFAHSDLSAYSVFEEAFTRGDLAGRSVARFVRG